MTAKLRLQNFLYPIFALLLSVQLGCATYQNKVGEARVLLSQDKPQEAAKVLQPLADKDSDDQLVYLLDYAVTLQANHQYKESANYFARAEKIADIQDYHSISKISASLLLTEEMVQYKGDDYEKVLLNGVNAVNYLVMNELDNALVEVRRLNEKLYKFKFEGNRNYDQNPFAFYMSAMIWEADKKWDDAYIDYKHAFDLIPGYPPLHEDLIRTAMRSGRSDEAEEWKKKFPEVKPRPEWRDPTVGELVIIYQQGWGPRKQPHPSSPRVPKLFPVYSLTQRARIEVEGTAEAVTEPIFSVQDVAIKTLDSQYAALIAKRVAGVGVKAVAADQIRQKNQILGEVAWLALNFTDRADLRQWSTLPQTFQIARIYLKGGSYKLRIHGLTGGGAPSGEELPEQSIDIKPGKKTFYSWRSFH